MNIFKKSKIGVKICSYRWGKLYSCFEDGNVVGYKRNKWTRRPKRCGPLAVFATLPEAIDFIGNTLSSGKIYFRCKYKESKEKLLYTKIRNMTVEECHYAPENTIFADKVKILDVIT